MTDRAGQEYGMAEVGGQQEPVAEDAAFDLVVTVALDSTPATVVLSSGVALTEAGSRRPRWWALQFAVAWPATRSAGAEADRVRADRGAARWVPVSSGTAPPARGWPTPRRRVRRRHSHPS
ncbi:hypothetical protein [Planomonospora parontospora]|uniref:hypothetical protein n=1 Tax=Planomonospora parontospora TaxID=58119 RepID=UPI001670DBA9|nr:hypothetical protein [Planomonospora parontospora]GGL57993.1 hypothetical protein GCM10014719_69260 [Planomonospora parontospora subsp. antibiotica]GII19891.1 hypothetical protein Ppa05_66170 [Planomonospora parontospora subsp. antibiotica]